jgi:hypothetical protein
MFLKLFGKIQDVFRKYTWTAYEPLLNLIRNYNENEYPAPEVLIFGDSVMERVADNDADRRPLHQMIKDALLPRYRCVSISYSAYNPKIYYYFVKALEKLKRHPKIVILPINIRSFSPQWDLRPHWQHEAEISILKKFIKNPQRKSHRIRESLRGTASAALMDSFKRKNVDFPLIPFNTIGQFLEVISSKPANESQSVFRRRLIFVFHYMYRLGTDHKQLILLKDILDMLQAMNIKILLYITPINVGAGEKYAGREFVDHINKNADMILSLAGVENDHLRFRNWVAALSSENFFDHDLATEHINEHGRRKLAQWIVQETASLQ